MTTPTTRTAPLGQAAPITTLQPGDLGYAPTARELLDHPELLLPPEVLIPYFVWRERITLFSSPDKGGKSTLLTEAVAVASAGGTWLGHQTAPVSTLWLLMEEHPSDWLRRLECAVSSNPNKIRVLDYPLKPHEELFAAVRHYRPDIVVIDTILRYAKGRLTDAGSSAQWNLILDDFQQLRRNYHVSIIGTHHTRRKDGEMRDSGDIPANADIVIEQKKRHENGRQKFEVRARFNVENFAVQRLPTGVYVLDNKDARWEKVLAFVIRSPGASSRAIRDEFKWHHDDTTELLTSMEKGSLIVNRGTKEASKWHPVTAGKSGE